MPIGMDEFESTGAGYRPTRRSAAAAERVLSFLASRPDRAFTSAEIRAATNVPRGAVGVALARLEDRGLVHHRGPYWAVVPGAVAPGTRPDV